MPKAIYRPLILIALVWGVCLSPASANSDVQRAQATLEARLELLSRQPQIAGLAVVLVSADETLLQRTFGVRAVGEPERVEADTRFRIASLSKGFASTVAGMMVQDGKLSWDLRVANEIDYFSLPQAQAAERATLEHLLSHRTGLPPNAYDNLLEANWQPASIVARYHEVEPLCAVGTCYGYQNVTFNLVEPILEGRVGDTFENAVGQRIFEPLGMVDSGFGVAHLTRDENHAKPHVKIRGDRLAERRLKTHYYRLPASAGINMNIEDMGRWLRAQLLGFPEAIGASLLAELRTPRVSTRREMRFGWRRHRLDGAWYGLGWRIYDYEGHQIVYHAGAVEGFHAQLAVFPEAGVALAALWNSNSNRPWGVVPEFADALFNLRFEDWMKLDSAPNRSGGGATAAQ